VSGIVRVSRTAHRADRADRAGRIVIGAAVALLTACAERTPDARVDTAGGDVAPAEAAAPAVAPACAPGNGGITLPEGFCATIFDDSAVAPRHIAVAANGDVYTNRQARRAGAAVLALRDTNGDGRADVRATFGTGFGTGVADRTRVV
jgi:hypothetical protein